MKSSFFRIAAVAAVLSLSGIAAFAQTDLKVEIPFAFTTPGGGQMPAGKYLVSQVNANSPTASYRFLNLETKKSILAMAPESIQRKGNLPAEIVFLCSGDSCAVSTLYAAGATYGRVIPTRVKPVFPATDIAEIHIPMGE